MELQTDAYINHDLKSITRLLLTSNDHQRLKWSKQLIFKLNLIHKTNVECSLNVELLKIDENDNLVITDSGNDREKFPDLRYLPPECVKKNYPIKSMQSDVWAAGICFYFINTGKFPWNKASLKDNNYRNWIENGKLEGLRGDFCNNVLKIVLCENPEKRNLKRVMEKVIELPLNFGAVGKFFFFIILSIFIRC